MRFLRRIPLILVAITIATTGLIGASAGASTTFAALGAHLTAAQESSGGQPGGTGTAIFSLNSRTGQVCYILYVKNIAPPTAAHIHSGEAGVNGPVVIPLPLTPGVTNTIAGCTTASKTLVQSIINDPSDYYTNVHNALYPGGAIRGQLMPLGS
ncbi:MAG TPA: CHRD domain-containing protein [Acidimicrobiales bacterium]|jgi:hypothetical protein|nr:CHRD domain-containing protein [Acidimicrobiales bacterium]